MEIAFFSIFNHEAKIWNSLNKIWIFSSLEKQKVYYYLVCGLKTDYLK